MAEQFSRRAALTAMGAGVAATGLAGRAAAAEMMINEGAVGADGKYALPPLPYGYDALEPHIDEQTMRLHHDKHHQGYVNGLNGALDKLAAAREAGDMAAITALSRDLAFHGSGHFLHTVFWTNLCPASASGEPSSWLTLQLEKSFGSVDAFQAQFTAAAGKVEASGWGLLVYEPIAKQMLVMQAEKHQNLTAWGVVPLLVIDVWEHAYYLRYQNNRGEYVKNFWNVVNWSNVEARLRAAQA